MASVVIVFEITPHLGKIILNRPFHLPPVSLAVNITSKYNIQIGSQKEYRINSFTKVCKWTSSYELRGNNNGLTKWLLKLAVKCPIFHVVKCVSREEFVNCI